MARAKADRTEHRHLRWSWHIHFYEQYKRRAVVDREDRGFKDAVAGRKSGGRSWISPRILINTKCTLLAFQGLPRAILIGHFDKRIKPRYANWLLGRSSFGYFSARHQPLILAQRELIPNILSSVVISSKGLVKHNFHPKNILYSFVRLQLDTHISTNRSRFAPKEAIDSVSPSPLNLE
ncbi:uncharacterized protein BDR25DRAFT_363391 [Lindgomyces ingoldianus]|uniref:Uncharacterized protein n=1 Tax=Lindgomyces ingoldianus TaxID=673940 RepID=A0ACB6Q7U4_9PLEO|nr:uncharacterized protein BDR25DRAFT_363391 [Lindgomyces ingoldianus]KAF2462911.1 hypothetical protein BDR25DRAFT_363391 [Lindgomyces ingoldianus]